MPANQSLNVSNAAVLALHIGASRLGPMGKVGTIRSRDANGRDISGDMDQL